MNVCHIIIKHKHSDFLFWVESWKHFWKKMGEDMLLVKTANLPRENQRKKRSRCHPHCLTDSWSLASSVQKQRGIFGCFTPKMKPIKKKENTHTEKQIAWITTTLLLHYITTPKAIDKRKPLSTGDTVHKVLEHRSEKRIQRDHGVLPSSATVSPTLLYLRT